ncbi:MAG: cobaltochelatase subunit CobN, partial [Microcystaceae cyanobacterium]
MHRLAATPGGWNPDSEGLVPEQTPAPIVILTAADTDIQSLAAALPHLDEEFGEIRAVNLLNLQQFFAVDDYADRVLRFAKVIILRLLGGRSYWDYGLEVVKELATERGITLWVLPGDDRPDGELMAHSTVTLSQVHQLWQYVTEGGVENWRQGLQWVSNFCLGTNYRILPPQRVPNVGLYLDPPLPPLEKKIDPPLENGGKMFDEFDPPLPPLEKGGELVGDFKTVGILFYRSHYLAGNTLVID